MSTASDHPLTPLVDVAAAALDLEIRPEWRPAVAQSLAVALAMAGRVATVPLDDESEPAPVFDAFAEPAP